MKNSLAILLLTSYFFAGAQTNTLSRQNPSDPKKLPENSSTKKYSSAYIHNVTSIKHDTCLNKKFSIVFYVVLDSNTIGPGPVPGVGIATTPTLVQIIDQLNENFKRICVSFENCTTIFIPNYNYGNKWVKATIEPTVTANYYTDKTINFYLVDDVDPVGTNESEGYTYAPTPTNLAAPRKDIIVLHKFKAIQNNGAATAHLFGHFFGLSHTHEELNPTASPPPPAGASSQELADGSNCATHGDLLCDTEADPGSQLVLMDSQNGYYVHPVDNFMSYYSPRNRFTQEQYNRMAYVISTLRLYLH